MVELTLQFVDAVLSFVDNPLGKIFERTILTKIKNYETFFDHHLPDFFFSTRS
jgi:hypothetical protein